MQKRLHIATVSLFLVLLFGFTVAFVLLPDKDFSAQENRSLRTFPAFSFEALASGEFSAAINDYFADQFPLRDFLVGIKGSTEIGIGGIAARKDLAQSLVLIRVGVSEVGNVARKLVGDQVIVDFL